MPKKPIIITKLSGGKTADEKSVTLSRSMPTQKTVPQIPKKPK